MTQLFQAKPFIIAEIGSNWGSFQHAKDSIAAAAACGAHAVKFQLFTEKDLFGPGLRDSTSDNKSAQHQLPVEWLPKLKEKADACGIELMCSAFAPASYDVVDPFVSVHKIASAELTYPQLLEKVKSLKKPILLSVGASAKGDIARAMQILRGGPQVVLMYCVASYPAHMVNLFQMQDLRETFDVPVGFSDHSLDVIYPALSSVRHFNAVVVEKHVNFAGLKTPDSGHSLSGEQFKIMCDYLTGKRDAKQFNPQPEEREMFLRHNRRLLAITDIQPGDAFRFGENFGCYRSLEDDSRGMSGFDWHELVKSNGAKRQIKAGSGIAYGDF